MSDPFTACSRFYRPLADSPSSHQLFWSADASGSLKPPLLLHLQRTRPAHRRLELGCLADFQSTWHLEPSDSRSSLRFRRTNAVAGRDLEREIVPLLSSEGLGLLVSSPLAGGPLSGKYGPRADGCRRESPHCLRVPSCQNRSCVTSSRCCGSWPNRKPLPSPNSPSRGSSTSPASRVSYWGRNGSRS